MVKTTKSIYFLDWQTVERVKHNDEKYSKAYPFRFIYSLRFMNLSLDSLVDNLSYKIYNGKCKYHIQRKVYK